LKIRAVRLAALLTILAVVGLWAVGRWRQQRPPTPPVIPLEGVEATTAAVIELARQKVLDDPTSGDAWGFLAKVLLANEFEKEAFPCLEQAEKRDPNNPRWCYLRGQFMFNSAEDVETREKALNLLRRATELGDENNTAESFVHLALAEALWSQGHAEEAGKHFRRVQQVEPDNPRLLLNLGQHALSQKRYDDAIALLTPVTRSPLARKRALDLLAQIQMLKGNHEQADRMAKVAQKLPADAGWSESFMLEVLALKSGRQASLAQVDRLQKASKYREANEKLLELAFADPKKADDLHLGRAYNFARLEDWDNTEKTARSLVKSRQPSIQERARSLLAAALFHRGDRLLRGPAGNRTQAIALLEESVGLSKESVRVQPRDALGHIYLGRALLGLDKTKQAVQAMEAAAPLNGSDPLFRYYLGMALAADGQDRAALENLEEAVRLNPSEKLASKTLEIHREKLAKKKRPP
jgi:cytochrome c-type biogenesis protein CcmH/NrfG